MEGLLFPLIPLSLVDSLLFEELVPSHVHFLFPIVHQQSLSQTHSDPLPDLI